MRRRPVSLAALACAAALAPTGAVRAQPPAAASADITPYDAAFFARAQPASAYDMVQLLPGFRLVEGDPDLRGYAGAAGNVLIDGRPFASKTETLADLLKRIPARDVARIDLIRSAAVGYDMQGYALLANVVRRSASQVTGRLEGEFVQFPHGLSAPRAAGGLSLRRGERSLELQGAIYREIDDEHGFGSRNRYAPDGSPLRLNAYKQVEGARVKEASVTYGQPLAGGALLMTGVVNARRMFADIQHDIYFPASAQAFGDERKNTTSTEGSARYDRDVGGLGHIELLASRRDTRIRGTEGSHDADGEERTHAASDAAETILRGVLRKSAGPVALEFGAEGAFNSLDSRVALTEDGVDVPLPAADVRVEETRSELFATATWRSASSLTLESGLRYERSRLTRSGDGRLETSLAALKPRLRVTYAAGAHDRFRALIEREVGQLDFEDFVSDPSITSDAVTAGARNLVPESLWRGELTWEHHVGPSSIVITARREWVSHVVDRVAIVTPEGSFDSVGNLGRGRRDELEADINLPLDHIGLKGLTVQGVAVIRHTRVRDPETGEMRRISDEAPYETQVEITQDLPAQRLRIGVTYVVAGAETKYKADEIEADRLDGRLEAFIEYKPDPRWTLRVFGRNLTDSPSVREREIYDGLRRRDRVGFREVRILRSGPAFGLNVQRTFGG